MFYKKFFSVLVGVVLLTSCSNGTTTKIQEFDVDGDVTTWNDEEECEELDIDEAFFSVKNNAVNFVEEDGKLAVDVVIVRGDKVLPQGVFEDGECSIVVYGNVNDDTKRRVVFDLKDTAPMAALYELSQGQELQTRFYVDEKDIEEYQQLTQKSFVENVVTEYAELWLFFEVNLGGISTTVVNSSKNDNEWDELLADYEQFVDNYIACMKKVANGDMSAMSEYTTLLEKANEMSEEIADIQGELSPSQLQRYSQLNQKLLNAASNF